MLANPDRFELAGVCDLEQERVAALARALGVTRTYTDPGAMLAAERPDVLCFATPPAVRLRLVELGVRHGVRAIAFEKRCRWPRPGASSTCARGTSGRSSATSSSTAAIGSA